MSASSSSPPIPISFIISPYHVGIPNEAVGAGPERILSHKFTPSTSNATTNLRTHLETLNHLVRVITIPAPGPQHTGEIGRSFEVMRQVSLAVSDAIAQGHFPVVLAGNCNNSVGTFSGVRAKSMTGSDAPDIIWFDAHPDFDTPDEQTTGYFDVNGVSILGGQCWKKFAGSIPGYGPLDLKRHFTYVGLRDFNEAQGKKVREAGIRTAWGGDGRMGCGAFEKELVDFLESEDGEERRDTMIHFDVDSLDISVGKSNFAACAGGLSVEDAVGCMREIRSRRKVRALTVASFDPGYEGADGVAEAAVKVVLSLVG